MDIQQEERDRIANDLRQIRELLSEIQKTTTTIEQLRHGGLLSEQACDDIYQQKIMPALQSLAKKQHALFNEYQSLTGEAIQIHIH